MNDHLKSNELTLVGEGFEVRLSKSQIEEGELIDVCIEVAIKQKCKPITYTSEYTSPEISLNLP